MAQMNISNLLWNDTNSGTIAYSEQVKDRSVDYSKYNKITQEIKTRFNLDDKFQSKLNDFFLYHYDEFHRFLEDDGVDPTIIDSWKEVQDFLEGLPDDETTWLKNKLAQLDNRITAMDIPDGGAYDISADHVDGGGNYAKYSSLSEALNAVTTDKQKPGMTVRFIQEFEPAKYTVVKTEGVTTQSTGTEIQSDPEIISGTYTAGELSVFSTLPTTLNSSLTYYLAVTETVDEQEVTTYTTWVITYAQSSDNKYVQYRCVANEFTTDVSQWQGITKELAFNSINIPDSDTVEKGFWIGEPDTEIDLSNYTELVNCYINTTVSPNIWVNPAGYKCKIIPITAGNRYIIKNNGNARINYAFLTVYTHTLNSAVSYASGCTMGRVSVGDETNVLAPSDAHYMFISTCANNIVHNPAVSIYNKRDIRKVDSVPSKNSKNLVQSGGVFAEVNGNVVTTSHTYNGGANYNYTYGYIHENDKFLIQGVSDSEFYIEVMIETSQYVYKRIGVLRNGGVAAIVSPYNSYNNKIIFNYSGTATFDVSISICKIEDVTKIPYKFHCLFSDIDAIKANIVSINGIIDKIDNKPFIRSYNLITNSTQKALVYYIEELELSVIEDYADKEFYIRILGVYQDNFYIQIWTRDGEKSISYNAPVSSLPESTNFSFEFGNSKIKAHVIINTKNISSMGYINSSDSQIVLNISSFIKVVIENKQVISNLFILEESTNDKMMNNNGNITASEGNMMSNYIPVLPNRTYKCSVGVAFINFFNKSKTRTRGLIQYDTPKIFTTQDNEYFVVISFYTGQNFLRKEMVMVQEVVDESEELNIANAGMRVNEEITDGGYSSAKINGIYKGIFTIGKALQNSNYISLSVSNGDKLIATSIVGSYQGTITNLHFYCSCNSTFNLTFGIGNIDQRNWGLISRTFTVEVVNGENNINISQAINEDERLFVIANSDSTNANAKLYFGDTGIHAESQENDITMSTVSGGIAIKYTINGCKLLKNTQTATVTQLSEVSATLNDKIQGITLGSLYLQSPDNNYYRLTISNAGVLTPVIVPNQGNILIMGNSYDVHPYVSGLWWGDFGMAASRKENDWKHQLLTKLSKNNNLLYSFTKQALADWETTWNKSDDTVEDTFSYNDTTLPTLANTPNYAMVIIRVGENNTDTNYDRVKLRVKNLLQYVKTKVGNDVPIVLGACVKIRTEQNPSFAAAAEEVSGVTYVDMTPAGLISPFSAGLNYKVLGDDGVWHTISESSMASAVAGHPNDMVFAKMAELFYPVVIEKLNY